MDYLPNSPPDKIDLEFEIDTSQPSGGHVLLAVFVVSVSPQRQTQPICTIRLIYVFSSAEQGVLSPGKDVKSKFASGLRVAFSRRESVHSIVRSMLSDEDPRIR